MRSRKQYLLEIRKEYERADGSGRGRLLDEAQKRTGLNRRYLIRILNRPLALTGRARLGLNAWTAGRHSWAIQGLPSPTHPLRSRVCSYRISAGDSHRESVEHAAFRQYRLTAGHVMFHRNSP